MKKVLEIKDMGIKLVANFLSSAVIPRPIAFVSTINKEGVPNLSPFSFFNVFSSDPPILIFSPAKSVLTGNLKDTLHNVKAHDECVIHIANYSMVEQLSVSSGTYPPGVNEFVKAGFTEEKSIVVKPPRVKEAPVAFECKVKQVISLGDQGGAGNLVVCEILLIHVDENILDEDGLIVPHLLDPISRLGKNNYARLSQENIFVTPKPLKAAGIGVDAIPQWVLSSGKLTGNELGKLASISELPANSHHKDPQAQEIIIDRVKDLLSKNEIEKAWEEILT